MLNYRSADTLFRRASGTVACVSVLALTAIVLFLLAQGLPIFKDVPIGDFLFTLKAEKYTLTHFPAFKG